MRMNLADLRAATRDWLDDPHSTGFDAPRLDRLLNEAYQDLINELDRVPQAWSMQAEADAKTITTVAGTREYLIGPARNILETVEVLSDGQHGPPLTVVPFWERNRGGAGVYYYRSGADGNFYLGLVTFDTPSYDSVVVFYMPGNVTRLVGDGDTPFEIPDEYHELLPLWAAVLGKFQENREAGGLAQAYAKRLDQFTSRRTLGAPNRKRRLQA